MGFPHFVNAGRCGCPHTEYAAIPIYRLATHRYGAIEVQPLAWLLKNYLVKEIEYYFIKFYLRFIEVTVNPSTTIGIFGGIAIVAIAVVFSVDQASLLWNPLGLLVVFGGTLAATLIAFPMNEVGRIFTVILIVLRNERLYAKDDQAELVSVARSVLRADIRAIETRLKSIKNPFLRLGIQLVIDNTALDDIVDIMTWRIEKLKAKEKAEALIFRAMASFAPAFGMIGTLLGLVNMLNALNADVAAIGSNMAIAMMTTLYGVIAGNLLFKPIAMKFEQRTQQRVALMMTVMQGVILLR